MTNKNPKSFRVSYTIVLFTAKKRLVQALKLFTSPFHKGLASNLEKELTKIDAVIRFLRLPHWQREELSEEDIKKLKGLLMLGLSFPLPFTLPPGKIGKFIWLFSWMVSPKFREDLIGDVNQIARDMRKEGESLLAVSWFIVKTLAIAFAGRIENIFYRRTKTE